MLAVIAGSRLGVAVTGVPIAEAGHAEPQVEASPRARVARVAVLAREALVAYRAAAVLHRMGQLLARGILDRRVQGRLHQAGSVRFFAESRFDENGAQVGKHHQEMLPRCW